MGTLAGRGRVPVQAVFIGVLVPLATLLLSGGTWLAYRAETREQVENLRREAGASTGQLATSLTLPVWYLDEPQIGLILDHVMENPAVELVALDTALEGLPEFARDRGADSRSRKDLIWIQRDIPYAGRTLGRVRVGFSTRFVAADLRAFLRESLWTLLGLDLLLVASVSILLWRVVLRPLGEIRRLAGLVSSGADVDSQAQGVPRYREFEAVHQSLLRTFALLKRREERYRTFFAHGPDGIVVLDPETTRILEFNDQACRQLGYTREEFQGLALADIEAAETAEDSARHIRNVMNAGIEDFPTLHRTKQGEVRDVQVTAQYIRVGGEPTYHCVWRDMTLRKAREAEVKKLHAQLIQSQKMESLGLLAGGVAHDMNNVLGAILGLASAEVETHGEGTSTRRSFDTIIKACERGAHMVRGLLRFSRTAPADERELDLNALLREEVLLLERTTFAKVHLALDLDPALGPMRGDASALTNLFMNLCVNAVDAMGEGGTLTLRTRNLDGQVEAQVEDTGTGMTKEVLEKALDPFFTTKEVGKGTGLGLSMAFSTVKAHHGRMDIRSAPGEGTCVTVRFPAAAGSGGAPPEAEAPPPGEAVKRLKVLVVDDDELVHASTAFVLKVLGHAVHAAWTGEEALRMIQEGLHPDVMILDLNMPGMGGAGTLDRMATLDPALPVLLATGRPDQRALDLVKAHPQATLLPKPFGIQELRARLDSL
ncbi:ATP-binding response regulator [Mesoterricola silvestris]|uniref:histidine kinase n=1 Tax=Mesoterricola silvestris TaxID=2927979 RepID=A0AA48GS74_9BACT|nr:ATP-binding protein [Mesoterricola silvestris]BDU73290.1 hypothetical protein METEAL_24640 [Mesoterricola silvestris]